MSLEIGMGIYLGSSSKGGGPDLFKDFNVVFDDTTIETIADKVTAWNNKQAAAAEFDLDTVIGTGINLSALNTGVALLTGNGTDVFCTPDSVAADITGDLDIRVKATLDSYTTGDQTLIGKWPEFSQNSYMLRIRSAGTLQYQATENGTTTIAETEALGAIDGETVFVRVTHDVDNGSGSNVIQLYTSSDQGVTWDPLGTANTTAGVYSRFSGTGEVCVGGIQGGSNGRLRGTISRALIFNGIDGTLAVDFNPSLATSSNALESFVSDTGETWLGRGNAFINASGFTGVYARGSVGLETAIGQLITSPSTVFAVFKHTLALPVGSTNLFNAKSNVGALHSMFTNTSNSNRWTLGQGSTIAPAVSYDSDIRVLTGQYNGDATSKFTISDVGNVTGDAGSNDWDFATFFADAAGALTIQGLFLFFAVIEGALSEPEITEIQQFLEAKYL